MGNFPAKVSEKQIWFPLNLAGFSTAHAIQNGKQQLCQRAPEFKDVLEAIFDCVMTFCMAVPRAMLVKLNQYTIVFTNRLPNYEITTNDTSLDLVLDMTNGTGVRKNLKNEYLAIRTNKVCRNPPSIANVK